MARQKQPKRVLMLMSDAIEIGQALTNLYGLNPEIEVHQIVCTQGIREKQSKIMTPQLTPQYEPVTVLYIVYTNPGDLDGFSIPQPEQVAGIKARITN